MTVLQIEPRATMANPACTATWKKYSSPPAGFPAGFSREAQ
jgi:hypothetical protein